MKTCFTAVSIVALTVVLCVVTNAQAPSEETIPSASVLVMTAAPPADDDAPYTLKGGEGVTVFQRDTAYGGGLSPIGFQLDFANGSRIHPFAHVNAGFLGFTKAIPIEDSGTFAFTLEGGGGIRVFTSERRAVTLGLRLHHISNGDRSGSNRGLNQFVFYARFSVFK